MKDPTSGEPRATSSAQPEESLRTRALRNGLWSMVTFFGTAVLGFVTVAILARSLGLEYGAIAALMTVSFYVDSVLSAGLGSTVVYEQEDGQSHRIDVAFTTNVCIAASVALLLFIGADSLAGFFRIEDQSVLFRILALAVLIRGFGQIPGALLRRDLEYKTRTGVSLARATTRMVVSLGLLWAGYGVSSAAWGIAVAEVVGVGAVLVMTSYTPKLRMNWAILRSLAPYSAAILGLRVTSQLSLNGDYLIVGNQLGDAALGVYYNAFRVPELVIGTIYIIFSDVALAVFSRARVTGGGDQVQTGLVASLEALCLYGFPAGVGLAVVAPSVVLVVFGPEWAAVAAPMAVLSLTAGLIAVLFASGDAFTATGRPNVLLALLIVHLPIEFAILMFGVRWGIVGVAWAQFAHFVVLIVVRTIVAVRVVKVSVRDQARAMVPGAVAAFGVVVFAAPVAASLEPGIVSLVAATAAGLLGALVALRLFAWESLTGVVVLIQSLRGNRSAT